MAGTWKHAVGLLGATAGVLIVGTGTFGGPAQAYPLPTTTTVVEQAPPIPTTTLLVVPPSVTQPPVGELPRTGGSNMTERLLAGGSLAVAGIGLVGISRRRRDATSSSSS